MADVGVAPCVEVTPFSSAEEAWLWCCAALRYRNSGARSGSHGPARPCEPDDVMRALDRLYRRRLIDVYHARVLRKFGELGYPPDRLLRADHEHRIAWLEAMQHLDTALRALGVLAPVRGVTES